MYLSAINISKSYGLASILNGASLTVNTGQRIGLVGPNGVGKSTLVKIIVGQIEADGGQIIRPANEQIGYLSQTIEDLSGTVQTLIDRAISGLRALEARMRALETQMAASAPDDLPEIMAEYAHVTERFEQQGGYEIDYRINIVLTGLRLSHIDRDRLIDSLSGGEKARMGLALLLLQSPALLLLDEPTNHLDFASLSWLEGYLSSYHGGILIISHDRQFLNRTVTSIIEIDEHTRQTKHYAGDYDAFLAAKAIERQRWEQEYFAQQEEIAMLRETIREERHKQSHSGPTRKVGGDKFAKGFFKGRSEVSFSRKIASADERLRRIEENPVPKPPKPLTFAPDFDPQALEARAPISVANVWKSFGDRIVLRDVSFTLGAQGRIALVGPNGSGKSTLIKILSGYETPDSGEITINPQVRLGYLDQEHAYMPLEATVFDAYRDGLIGSEQALITDLLATGLFHYDEIRRQVKMLSSGQKRKLQIAGLMATQANLLLLDEPTNFVSFDVLEAFEDALRSFPGPVVAASHDRRFLQRFDGEIWELHDGALIKHVEGYEEYIEAARARA